MTYTRQRLAVHVHGTHSADLFGTANGGFRKPARFSEAAIKLGHWTDALSAAEDALAIDEEVRSGVER